MTGVFTGLDLVNFILDLAAKLKTKPDSVGGDGDGDMIDECDELRDSKSEPRRYHGIVCRWQE